MQNRISVLIRYFPLTVALIYFTGCSGKLPEPKHENDPALTNISWVLQTLNSKPIQEASVELYFDHETSRLSGFTGCNKLTGTFLIGPERVKLIPTAATRFICFGTGALEKEFYQCLVQTDSLAVKNDSLYLGQSGKTLAVLTKKVR